MLLFHTVTVTEGYMLLLLFAIIITFLNYTVIKGYMWPTVPDTKGYLWPTVPDTKGYIWPTVPNTKGYMLLLLLTLTLEYMGERDTRRPDGLRRGYLVEEVTSFLNSYFKQM